MSIFGEVKETRAAIRTVKKAKKAKKKADTERALATKAQNLAVELNISVATAKRYIKNKEVTARRKDHVKKAGAAAKKVAKAIASSRSKVSKKTKPRRVTKRGRKGGRGSFSDEGMVIFDV